jgi:tetratricopeptide (TPR) repeat protein
MAVSENEIVPPLVNAPETSTDADSVALWLRVLAKVLSCQASFSGHESARPLLDRSLKLLDRPELAGTDTRRERAFIFRRTGLVVLQEDREQAQDLQQRSLALYRELGAEWEAAEAMASLGMLAWRLGDYDRTRQFVTEALAAFRKLGAPIQLAWTLSGLGMVALMQGRLEESERRLREACAIADKATGARPMVTYLGWLLLARGQFVEAVKVLRQEVVAQAGRGSHEAFPLTWLAAVEIHQGRYGDGRVHAQSALAMRREVGLPDQVACTLMVQSWVSLAQGAYAQAEELLRESVSLYRQVEQRDEGGWAVACLGYAARGLGWRDQAWAHVEEALRTAIEIHAFFPLIFGLPLLALLLADAGEVARAVELYALTAHHPFVANSRWFGEVAEKHIAATSEGLPPEAVAAAQEVGRSRDLWETAKELLEELEG